LGEKFGAVALAICLGGCLGVGAHAASSLDRQLAKLGPEERAHQACVIKGLDKIHADKKLPGADFIEAGVLGDAVIKGTSVTAKGGAIRAKHKWYKLSFDCTVTADQMKATAFTYKIGPEIPKDQWEKIGLWE
jgi:hypothetical protein